MSPNHNPDPPQKTNQVINQKRESPQIIQHPTYNTGNKRKSEESEIIKEKRKRKERKRQNPTKPLLHTKNAVKERDLSLNLGGLRSYLSASLSLSPGTSQGTFPTDSEGTSDRGGTLLDLDRILGGEDKNLKEHFGRICFAGFCLGK